MNLYHPTGIFLGGHSLEERNQFVERWIAEYDERHPGNTMLLRQKRKYARMRWREHVERQLERDKLKYQEVM